MAYGDYYDTQEFDYLLGTTKQAVEDIQLAVADASSLAASGGATTQVVGFDSGGNPVPIGVQGDSNGAGLSVSAGILTATLTQDLRTTASPTFANLTITNDLPVASGGTGASTAANARTNLGIDDIATKKSNLAAAVAPAVTDDGAAGYAVGSFWCDTTADDAYICLDSTNGAAVWKKITP